MAKYLGQRYRSHMRIKAITKSPVEFLRDTYIARKEKNNSYSMHSFARDLGISKSLLSRIFTGSRPISMKLAVQISTALDLNESHSRALLLNVIQSSSKNAKISKKVKAQFEKNLNDAPEDEENIVSTTVEIEQFKAMSSWHHLAVLNLTTLKNFKFDLNWMAKQLQISHLEIREAVDRLIDLGLLTETEGTLKRTKKSLFVKTIKSEFAVRNFHSQMIIKAHEELKDTSQEAFNRRLISGITFACDKDQIELLREKIEKLQQEFLILSAASEKEDLYQMNIQFFPLIKSESGAQT